MKKPEQTSISPETNLSQAPIRGIKVSKNYFEQITNEEKTVEVRMITQESGRGKVGQIIIYKSPDNQICKRRISKIRAYKSITELANNEVVEDILPQKGKKTSTEELVKLAKQHFKSELSVKSIESNDYGDIEITRDTPFEAWDLEPVEE
jgi:ASC-1-like (ASCH) protein